MPYKGLVSTEGMHFDTANAYYTESEIADMDQFVSASVASLAQTPLNDVEGNKAIFDRLNYTEYTTPTHIRIGNKVIDLVALTGLTGHEFETLEGINDVLDRSVYSFSTSHPSFYFVFPMFDSHNQPHWTPELAAYFYRSAAIGKLTAWVHAIRSETGTRSITGYPNLLVDTLLLLQTRGAAIPQGFIWMNITSETEHFLWILKSSL